MKDFLKKKDKKKHDSHIYSDIHKPNCKRLKGKEGININKKNKRKKKNVIKKLMRIK